MVTQPADRIWEAISVSSFGKRLAKMLESWFWGRVPGSGLGDVCFFVYGLGFTYGILVPSLVFCAGLSVFWRGVGSAITATLTSCSPFCSVAWMATSRLKQIREEVG